MYRSRAVGLTTVSKQLNNKSYSTAVRLAPVCIGGNRGVIQQFSGHFPFLFSIRIGCTNSSNFEIFFSTSFVCTSKKNINTFCSTNIISFPTSLELFYSPINYL